MAKTKRPWDVSQRAKLIVDIATGEAAEVAVADTRNPAAVALGQLGGKARAKSLSPARRKAIAKKAAKKRWGGSDGAAAPAR